MADLKDWPKDFVPLFSLMRSILGIFQFVAKLKKRVLDVLEAIWWWLAITSGSNGRHDCYCLFLSSGLSFEFANPILWAISTSLHWVATLRNVRNDEEPDVSHAGRDASALSPGYDRQKPTLRLLL